MSYARFGPRSDVYVYRDVAGGWTAHWPGGAENLATPALWEPPTSVLVAGPTPWGRDVPWAPMGGA